MLSNLAYHFLDELSTVFCLCVRHFAQQIVVEDIKDKVWKQEVESLVKDSFVKAKTGWHFDSLSALESDEMFITDNLQVDLVSEVNKICSLTPCMIGQVNNS